VENGHSFEKISFFFEKKGELLACWIITFSVGDKIFTRIEIILRRKIMLSAFETIEF